MINLLKFEFRKLFRQKSFYVCTAVMLVMSLFGILLGRAIASNAELNMPMPTVCSSLLSAVSSSSFTMICGIFIALFVCTDFDRQTIKNVYSRGFSRESVYFAKLIACVAATAIMFALTLVFTFAAGTLLLEKGEAASALGGLICGQAVYCIACTLFVFSVSLIVKKVSISVALAILGPSLIGMVIDLVDAILNIENVQIGSYWLNSFAADLTNLATDGTRLFVCIALSLVYAAAFVAAGYFISRKQEY